MHDHRHIDDQPFPKAPLYTAAVLIAVVLTGTALVRAGVVEGPATASEVRTTARIAQVEVRTIRFVDMADGGVAIVDVADGSRAGTIAPGAQTGFVRGVMRGLARDRHLAGIGAEVPFRLTRFADGALTLDDRATRRHIELNSFGPVNRAAFAALLKSGQAAQTAETASATGGRA